jgi:DnaJ domain
MVGKPFVLRSSDFVFPPTVAIPPSVPIIIAPRFSPPRRITPLMTDPYAELGLPADADDEVIRRRYLELVKQFSPEHHPEKFAAVRRAYESLRDLETRLRYRLFEAGKQDSIDAILEELACRTSRRRLSLQALVNLAQKP